MNLIGIKNQRDFSPYIMCWGQRARCSFILTLYLPWQRESIYHLEKPLLAQYFCFKADIRSEEWARMREIIAFLFLSTIQVEKKYRLNGKGENTQKMQRFSRLKFKKYLQFRIFKFYLGEYLEINRLIICLPYKFKKRQINIFSDNIPHALLIEETMQLLATPTHK